MTEGRGAGKILSMNTVLLPKKTNKALAGLNANHQLPELIRLFAELRGFALKREEAPPERGLL